MKIDHDDIIRQALQLAHTYRELIVELDRAANVLEQAGNPGHDHYPVVTSTRLITAIKRGMMLGYFIDKRY